MAKLYEISEKYLFLNDLIDREPVVSHDYLNAELKITQDTFCDKAANIARFIINLESDATEIEIEELRLSARKKRLKNKAEWLKSYLMKQMLDTDIEEIKAGHLNIALKQNSLSVQINNELAIPQEYFKIIPETRQPDKIKILKTFKENGEILPGIEIVKNMRLEIK